MSVLDSVRLVFPFPPSTNGLFINVRGAGRVRSPGYRKWAADAGWRLQAQRPPKIKGPVNITVLLCPPNKRRADADNRLKAPLDLLVTHGVIEGDDSRYVRSVTARWVDEGEPCSVIVESVK